MITLKNSFKLNKYTCFIYFESLRIYKEKYSINKKNILLYEIRIVKIEKENYQKITI